MFVNVEFLDDEPIENIITCLNYHFDKVIFFGYAEIIKKQQKHTEQFLKKYCQVKEVVFIALVHHNLRSIKETMRLELQRCFKQSQQVFIDITGGESIILIAFGQLSDELALPMHMYEIASGKLIELDDDENRHFSNRVKEDKVVLNLERYIEAYGGVINPLSHKHSKNLDSPQVIAVVETIWDLATKYIDDWNDFTTLFQHFSGEDKGLDVEIASNEIVKFLNHRKQLRRIDALKIILDDFERCGLINNLEINGYLSFSYQEQLVKDCLLETGCILELHTCLKELKDTPICQVGVHLDWDGILHPAILNIDVVNEIDVLSLRGYVLNFMSCKSGRVEKTDLYELDTVAKRFGGKYATKQLVCRFEISQIDQYRADEMNIEISYE